MRKKYEVGDVLNLPDRSNNGNGSEPMTAVIEGGDPQQPVACIATRDHFTFCEGVWRQVLEALNTQSQVLKTQGEALAAQSRTLEKQGEVLISCQLKLKNIDKLEATYEFLKLEVQRNNGEVSNWAKRCATRCETLHKLLEIHLNGSVREALDVEDPPTSDAPPTLEDVEREDLRRSERDG